MNCSLKRKEESQWKNIKAKIDISAKTDFQREKWTCASILLEKSRVLQSQTTVGKLSWFLWNVYLTIQNNKISSSRIVSRNYSFIWLEILCDLINAAALFSKLKRDWKDPDPQHTRLFGILLLLHLILSHIPHTQPSSSSRFSGSKKWSMRLLHNRVVLVREKP